MARLLNELHSIVGYGACPSHQIVLLAAPADIGPVVRDLLAKTEPVKVIGAR